jgi:DNA-directed RNA polymerase specialized sigma24 family protein
MDHDNSDKAEWLRSAIARFESPLTHYAAALMGDGERARDIVQDTFMRLCGQRPFPRKDRRPGGFRRATQKFISTTGGQCLQFHALPAWRNWQTRQTQNLVLVRVCGFDPLRRHHLSYLYLLVT